MEQNQYDVWMAFKRSNNKLRTRLKEMTIPNFHANDSNFEFAWYSKKIIINVCLSLSF